MKSIKRNFILLMLSALFCFCAFHNAHAQTSVKIGNKEWLLDNLNVATFKNGDAIPEVKTEEAWVEAGKEGKPAWCYYDNDPKNGDKYGKLYNWYAVTDTRGLAPSGWHIPSDDEWTELTEYLGGIEIAGNKIKSKNSWKNNGNGDNESGFLGLPGGLRGINGEFLYIGASGYWWGSSQFRVDNAGVFHLSYLSGYVYRSAYKKDNGCSIRCLKD